MLRIRRSLACERGDALVEGLFAFALVLLVVAVGAQALAYAHARSVAAAAAQDGARAAAAGGTEAGIARANAILGAAGGAGEGLRASASEDGDEVTVSVAGRAGPARGRTGSARSRPRCRAVTVVDGRRGRRGGGGRARPHTDGRTTSVDARGCVRPREHSPRPRPDRGRPRAHPPLRSDRHRGGERRRRRTR